LEESAYNQVTLSAKSTDKVDRSIEKAAKRKYHCDYQTMCSIYSVQAKLKVW